MRKFFEENQVLVYEEKPLRMKLIDQKTGIFTPDQYYNRFNGRTPCSKSERMVMKQKLDEVRAEFQEKLNK